MSQTKAQAYETIKMHLIVLRSGNGYLRCTSHYARIVIKFWEDFANQVHQRNLHKT